MAIELNNIERLLQKTSRMRVIDTESDNSETHKTNVVPDIITDDVKKEMLQMAKSNRGAINSFKIEYLPFVFLESYDLMEELSTVRMDEFFAYLVANSTDEDVISFNKHIVDMASKKLVKDTRIILGLLRHGIVESFEIREMLKALIVESEFNERKKMSVENEDVTSFTRALDELVKRYL